MNERETQRQLTLNRSLIALVGGFGSGKTEVAVNLAIYCASTKTSATTIVDLDLVNPYFRSREAIADMERDGIRVIAPRDGQFYADLPILLPEVKGVIEHHEGCVILDVGGDAQGSRALGSLANEFEIGQYEMFMVLNARRPQTSDVPGCIATMDRIQTTTGLRFTGLVSNTHLIDETDAEIVRQGYRLAQDVGNETGLPVMFISAKKEVLETIDLSEFSCPVLPLTRRMLKPWEHKSHPAT